MRILMIEDHAGIAAGTQAALGLLDDSLRFDTAATLAAAVACIEQGNHYDVALVDLSLPDASGYQVPTTLRRLCPATVIVVVTGRESEQLAVKLTRRGVQDFVPKSEVTPKRLLRTIRLACARQKREDKLREAATIDALTGALNRRGFQQKLLESLALTRRIDRHAALFTIDLDYFKTINDRYGHPAGDAVLHKCVARMRRNIRLNDHIGRVGGDEFLLLLNGLPPGVRLGAAADKIQALLSQPIQYDGQNVPVQVSMGLAIAPLHATDARSWLQASDKALYQAKLAGRGCWKACSRPALAAVPSDPSTGGRYDDARPKQIGN